LIHPPGPNPNAPAPAPNPAGQSPAGITFEERPGANAEPARSTKASVGQKPPPSCLKEAASAAAGGALGLCKRIAFGATAMLTPANAFEKNTRICERPDGSTYNVHSSEYCGTDAVSREGTEE
jgi:hypothetical protein